MFTKADVLFPTDFSEYSMFAFRYAVALAKRYQARLHIVHVLDAFVYGSTASAHGLWITRSDMETLVASIREHSESRLEHLQIIAETAGCAAEYHELKGVPAREIIHQAEEIGAGLIVMATHGRKGLEHLLLGGTCEKVVRHSKVPVLTVKHPEHEFLDEDKLALELRRILVPIDFSPQSESVLPYAASLAKQFDAVLELFHAAEVPVTVPEFVANTDTAIGQPMVDHAQQSLEQIGAQLEGVRVESRVAVGVAHREICAEVQSNNVDLVVMSTHGRTGLAHLLYGSVAERVVRMARCPVLTVRPDFEAVTTDGNSGGKEAAETSSA